MAPIAAVVVNPVKVSLERLRAAVAAAERAHGWDPSIWLETSAEDPGVGQAREALERGARMVLAAGGDGTVRAVAEALGGEEAALGLVPVGTGNLLARNVGIEIGSLERAVDIAFGGRVEEIDYGLVEVERPDGSREQTAFAVLCGVGIDAAMIANTDDDLKRRVGWVAYVGGVLRSLRGGHAMKLRFRIDGAPARATHANTVMIGNCGILPGGIVLLPEAIIDDGQLDIAVLRPRGLVGWLRIWSRVVLQSGLLHRTEVGRRILVSGRPIRALNYSRGEDVVIRLDSGPEDFEVDGDAFGQIVAARMRAVPGGLRVRVPAGGSSTRKTAVEHADEAIARLQTVVEQLPPLPGVAARWGSTAFGRVEGRAAERRPGVPVESRDAQPRPGIDGLAPSPAAERSAREELGEGGLGSPAEAAARTPGAQRRPDPAAAGEPVVDPAGD